MILFILLLLSQCSLAAPLEKILDLEGAWKFEIGDNLAWAHPDFNDQAWEEIEVPGSWENEGFPGYDGYAWYRTQFIIPAEETGNDLYLRLGYIDDVDEVFLNGRLVGSSGGFPPQYQTAYNIFRNYLIPAVLLSFGTENVLAVRVFDEHLEGGIVKGPVGFYKSRNRDLTQRRYDLSFVLAW